MKKTAIVEKSLEYEIMASAFNITYLPEPCDVHGMLLNV